MRERVVLQAADVENRDGEIHGRLDVRREEGARFLWMPVNAQGHVERSFDGGDGAGYSSTRRFGCVTVIVNPLALTKSMSAL